MSLFEDDGIPLSLRDLGSPADWLGDILSLAGLVVICVGLTFLAWALIDTPDGNRHAPTITINHNGE